MNSGPLDYNSSALTVRLLISEAGGGGGGGGENGVTEEEREKNDMKLLVKPLMESTQFPFNSERI